MQNGLDAVCELHELPQSIQFETVLRPVVGFVRKHKRFELTLDSFSIELHLGALGAAASNAAKRYCKEEYQADAHKQTAFPIEMQVCAAMYVTIRRNCIWVK